MHTSASEAIGTLETRDVIAGQMDENLFSTDQARWEALVHRDQRADGAFVYGVLTTGVYCRPTCPSKMPNRDNVRFFETSEDAERAGLRPCKRCSPDSFNGEQAHIEAILQVCRLIEESGELPSLAELANAVGLSPSHFHRVFKRTIGVTPKQYAMAKRLDRVRAGLTTGSTVTEAMYEAGFASSSRFYENSMQALGMKPSDYRRGGRGMDIRFAVAQSYLGAVLIAATPHGICAIDFGDNPRVLEERLRARFPEAEIKAGDVTFATWVEQVLAFLDVPGRGLDLPLDIQGTAFQRRVWMALRDIPAGSTASYADIADRIGHPKAARAVAQACASNPIAVAIPCHRVVRSDGELGGYRWGLERKRVLLAREANEQR